MGKHRYLVALLPGPGIGAEVLRLRGRLQGRIGRFGGLAVPPHITLCLADIDPALGPAAIRAVERGTAGAAPFALRYEGIAHFPDRRTIYIDPVEKDRIAALREPIAAALGATLGPEARLLCTREPHLTIAASLKPAQFAEAWLALAPHRFSAQDGVDAVTVLWRELRPEGRYAVAARIGLA